MSKTHLVLEDFIELRDDKLYWKRAPNGRVNVGDECGGVTSEGYRRFSFGRHPLLTHRVIWYLTYGSWPSGRLDHINRDKLDNRICNLREVSATENKLNSKLYSNNKSGYKGVYKMSKNRWGAAFRKDYLGSFKTPEEAALAYNKYAEPYHEYVTYNEVP